MFSYNHFAFTKISTGCGPDPMPTATRVSRYVGMF